MVENDSFRGFLRDMGVEIELHTGNVSAMTRANKDRIDMLYRLGSELFTIEENLVGALGRANPAFESLLAGSQDVYKNFSTMTLDNTLKISKYFDDAQELQRDYIGIMSSNLLQFHGLKDKVSADDMARLTLQRRALGLSTDETQQFLERQFAMTGEVNDELLKETLAYANAIETSTDISSKIISSNVSKMMSEVEIFGNMTVEEMSEAAAAIAKVGLEVNDVSSMMKKFNSFESAADSVAKLTQVFGVQLDTLELMTLSQDDPEALALMLQESFEMAGVDMASMDMPAKRMLASALGGIGIQEVEKLLGPAGAGLSQFASQVSGATGGVDTAAINESLSRAENDLSKINRLGTSIAQGSANASALANQAIVQSFTTGMRTMQAGMQRSSDAAATMLGNIAETVPNFSEMMGLSGAGGALDVLKEKADSFLTSVESLNASINSAVTDPSSTAAEQNEAVGRVLIDHFTEGTSQIDVTFARNTAEVSEALNSAFDGANVEHTVSFENIDTAIEVSALIEELERSTEISPASVSLLREALTTAIASNTPVTNVTVNADLDGIVDLVVADVRVVLNE
jgi:hypothetical protein